ncbi:glycoside hydrolase family 5 protein [Flagellimonas sp. 2504JD4-2]
MKIIYQYFPLFLFLAFFLNPGCSSSEANDKKTEEIAQKDNSSEDGEPENKENDENENNLSYESAVVEYGQLSVNKNKMVDKNGTPVQLRGMSFYWSQWVGKYYTAETVKWLKDDWQCNVIRAALAVEHGGYLANPEVEKQKIVTVIDSALEHGLYVIIDWHDHNAENHSDEAIAFFGEMAQKYGHYPNVIYETYNEPLKLSWSNVLKPYHDAVIAEIRKYDPDNLIICGTPNWSQDVDDVIFSKIDDPNVMYTLHYYAATHKKALRDKALVAINNDIPLFVTEYGVSEANGDGTINAEEAEIWWNFLDEHGISHLNWSIADKDELSAALKPGASTTGDWPLSDLTTSGTMIRNEIRNKNKAY